MDGLRSLLAIAALLVGWFPAETRGDRVDFELDVWPILARHCFRCHSGDAPESGFRLDHRGSLTAMRADGPLVNPGRSAASRLIHAVSGGASAAMPPTGSLSDEEVITLKRWVDEGLEWTEVEVATAADVHWAFQPIRSPKPPAVADPKACASPVDRFVLARLEQEGLRFEPELERGLLLRRLSLDLRGLPPTADEVLVFEADTRPDAYERIVDRYLAGPAFAERWAQHWLDLARYADSDGFSIDEERPHVWRYRDWVVRAIAEDMPFDRFTIRQLAGDLLDGSDWNDVVAAGFHRNATRNTDACVIPAEDDFRVLVERTNVTGAVWLGLTFECAQCHDHIFDPVSQADYYRVLACFEASEDVTRYRDPAEWHRLEDEQAEIEAAREARVDDMRAEITEELRPSVSATTNASRADSSAPSAVLAIPVVAVLLAGVAGYVLRHRRRFAALAIVVIVVPGIGWTAFAIGWGDASPETPTAAAGQFGDQFEKRVKLKLHQRLSIDPDLMQLKERSHEIAARREDLVRAVTFQRRSNGEPTRIRLRGSYLQLGDVVEPGVPDSVGVRPFAVERPFDRLQLAEWIVDDRNPLTARVVVNRVWSRLFGRGFVDPPHNFGIAGSPPTHPELLDWLANEFRRSGWSRKVLIRTIVTSTTYRQRVRPQGAASIADWLFAGQSRLPLDAETIRDSQLLLAGSLDRRLHGPPFKPPLSPRVTAPEFYEPTPPEQNHRRSLYMFRKRREQTPLLEVFGSPRRVDTCARRETATTPLQAMVLLNSGETIVAARTMARRLLTEHGSHSDSLVDAVFLRVLARRCDDVERNLVASLERDVRNHYDEHLNAAAEFVGSAENGVDLVEWATWTAVVRAVFNLDEAIVRP